MAVHAVWFMLLNMALMLPVAMYFTYTPMPYAWMYWLGVPAVIGALMIGIGVQLKVRHKEDEQERMRTF